MGGVQRTPARLTVTWMSGAGQPGTGQTTIREKPPKFAGATPLESGVATVSHGDVGAGGLQEANAHGPTWVEPPPAHGA